MRTFPVWKIAHEGDYRSVLEVLLAGRCLSEADLEGGAQRLHAPALMRDLERGVERLAGAIRRGEKIVVYGDYDVDGVTSTAVIMDLLERAGADCDYLLPDRHVDGYGLRPPGVTRARERDASLIVTVDNGISAHEALEAARAAGMEVVVVDHHRQTEDLPPAHSIINPNRRDCPYPFKGLAGVGVTFKVVQALSEAFIDADERRAYLNSLLDLVALGTVADIVPVVDENRILIRQGFRVMERGERPGLAELRTVARASGPVTSTAVAFFLGPRLNAAGRLASADLALRLLRARDAAEAQALAAELEALNSRRQQLQRTGIREAETLVGTADLAADRILVLLGEGWELGVIGLIASQLSERFYRPVAVCTDARGDGTYVGSARSIPGYDMVAGISCCSRYLQTYGGHAGAAGFSLEGGHFEAFRAALIDHANQNLAAEDLVPSLAVDLVLRAEDIAAHTAAELARLEPFGPGNEVPVFAARDLEVQACTRVGRGGEHLKLGLRAGDCRCTAVWWRNGEAASRLNRGDRIDAAFTLEEDTYTGNGAVQMVIRDLCAAAAS
ncbi:MAG: single-stranded-DNA-specific exonuclease RecJ [Gemmatimonadota bacterium]